jgi:hypothetical protein
VPPGKTLEEPQPFASIARFIIDITTAKAEPLDASLHPAA